MPFPKKTLIFVAFIFVVLLVGYILYNVFSQKPSDVTRSVISVPIPEEINKINSDLEDRKSVAQDIRDRAVASGEGELCLSIDNFNSREHCIIDVAVSLDDKSLCGTLIAGSDPRNHLDSCSVAVISQRAINNQDISICEQTLWRERCENNFFDTINEPEGCLDLPNKNHKICLQRFSISLKDYSICLLHIENQSKNGCLSYYARFLDDVDACWQASDKAARQQCINGI